jgi:hypothetical protein
LLPTIPKESNEVVERAAALFRAVNPASGGS